MRLEGGSRLHILLEYPYCPLLFGFHVKKCSPVHISKVMLTGSRLMDIHPTALIHTQSPPTSLEYGMYPKWYSDPSYGLRLEVYFLHPIPIPSSLTKGLGFLGGVCHRLQLLSKILVSGFRDLMLCLRTTCKNPTTRNRLNS